MDRLTYRTGAGTPNLNYPAHITEDQIAKSAFRQMAIERLAAYEDTGLEPEEIDHLRSLAEMVSGIAPDRLREIVQAERDGRVVVMPCKPGDTVWVISHCENVMVDCDDDYDTGTGERTCPFEGSCDFEECDDGNRRIFETTCTGFFLSDDKNDMFFDRINAEFFISDFGKTVFLTRAEAEAAMKGAEHE